MVKTIWALEIDGFANKAFDTIEKAKQAAYDKLVEWNYDPADDKDGVFKELEDSFNDPNYSGFWVDELLYCYEVEYEE